MRSERVKVKPPSRRGQSRDLDPNTTYGPPTKRQRLKNDGHRPCPRAGAQPECASTQNSTLHREPIFFIRPQALEASNENALAYDGWSSGPIIYTYVEGNPISYVDPEGLFGLPGAIAGGVMGAIGGGLGASANGGSWVTGAMVGGVSGAVVGGILGPWAGSSAGGQAFLRSTTGVLGNAMGQGTRIGDKCFCGINVGSLAGSAIGGAVAGVRAASIAANSYSGSLASQVAQRCMAGTSGSATSTASGVVGTALGAGGCSC